MRHGCPKASRQACRGCVSPSKSRLQAAKSPSPKELRTLKFEALESRELLSIVPGYYLSGVVGSDSRFYITPVLEPGGSMVAIPVAQLVSANGQNAPAPRDAACRPGYAYAGSWDKQFLDVTDNANDPLGLPSTLRSWDLSALAQQGEGDNEETLLPIPVVTLGKVYMPNPAYPGPGEPRNLDVRLNALEWSPELPDGTRLLFGAGYAGVAGQKTIRGHYLFVVNQHYGKAQPLVNLGVLGVESAGDIAFGPDGTLYLSLKGNKLLAVRDWHTNQPTVQVRSLWGQAEDFDALLPGSGSQLVGIAQDGDYYQVNLVTFESRLVGNLSQGNDFWQFGPGNGNGAGYQPLIYGALFGTRMPENLGTISNSVLRTNVTPYLFARWYQFDVASDGILRVQVKTVGGSQEDLRVELYQRVNGGELIPAEHQRTENGLNVDLAYTRARADRPGQDFTYYVRVDNAFLPFNLRVEVTPDGPWPEIRLGVLGDMLSQEYSEHWFIQASGWYDLLVQTNRVDGGHWAEEYPDWRWRGYEFNWANWWATTDSILSTGLLDGIVAQAEAGLVSHVVVALGPSDYFNDDAYQAIYNNSWSSQQIAQFDAQRLESLRQALQRLTATGVPVLLSTVIDPGFAPGIQAPYWESAKRARVSQAVDNFNQKLTQLAGQLGVPIIDSNALMKAIFGSATSPATTIWVGGVPFLHGQGDGPTWTFTANGICPGTVLSGLWANLIIRGLNQVYGTNIAPLSDQELLSAAGLADQFNPAGPAVSLPYEQWIILPQLSPADNGLGGMAWLDANRNGVRESDESPVANVTVTLMWAGWDETIGTPDDTAVATTMTDATGRYRFDSLVEGVYYVKVTPPPKRYFTYYHAGTDPWQDSDIVPVAGVSQPLSLQGGVFLDANDIGLATGSILSVTNLGVVDYREFLDRLPATGQLYYQFETTREGLVSLALETRTGDAILVVTNADGSPLQYNVGSGQVDLWATGPRQVFRVWVGGLRSASNLAIGNLLQFNSAGGVLTIFGSSQRDQVEISLEPIASVAMNRLSYQQASSEASLSRIVYKGSGDLVRLEGTSGPDRVNLTPGRVAAQLGIGGRDLPVQLDNWNGNFEIDLGLGTDILRVGSAPAEVSEVFEYNSGAIRWRSEKFDHRVWGAEDILAAAGNGGNDSAFLRDSRGSTTFESGPNNPNASRHEAALSGLTADFYPYRVALRGFRRVLAEVPGTDDKADFYDTANAEDRFYLDQNTATWVGPEGRFIKIHGAERVRTFGSTGTVADLAWIDGGPGDDVFEAEGTVSRMLWNGSPINSAELYHFRKVVVTGKGGTDQAQLVIPEANSPVEFYGSLADRFARLRNTTFWYELKDFLHVAVGPAEELAETLLFLPGAKATLVDSPGRDSFTFGGPGGETRAVFGTFLEPIGTLDLPEVSPRFELSHFAEITVESRNGLPDIAWLESTEFQTERFVGTADYCSLTAESYKLRLLGFGEVFLLGFGDSSPPTVALYGTAEDDRLTVGPLYTGEAFVAGGVVFQLEDPPRTRYFIGACPHVAVYANDVYSGGTDRMHLLGTSGWRERITALPANRTLVYYAESSAGASVQVRAIGFSEWEIQLNAPDGDDDRVLVVDTPGDDLLQADGAEDPNKVILQAVDQLLTFEDLAEITAVRFLGGNDIAEISNPELLQFAVNLVGQWQED
jgi:hypothetical protein